MLEQRGVSQTYLCYILFSNPTGRALKVSKYKSNENRIQSNPRPFSPVLLCMFRPPTHQRDMCGTGLSLNTVCPLNFLLDLM